jgi:hypothetical protein
MNSNHHPQHKPTHLMDLATSAPLPLKEAAAAQAESRISIDASASRVWHVLTDVGNWPRWNPAVAWVRRGQPLALGAAFEWKSQGFKVTSTITDLQAARRLAWTGRALGTRALHVWEITPTATGVVVRTAEAFHGWLPRLMPKAMQQKLEATLPAWLSALQAEAERGH